jgi:hypothetical protein
MVALATRSCQGCSRRLTRCLNVGAARRQSDESLFEALQALAFARWEADGKAKKACVALLQKLYVASGHGEHASAWVETI